MHLKKITRLKNWNTFQGFLQIIQSIENTARRKDKVVFVEEEQNLNSKEIKLSLMTRFGGGSNPMMIDRSGQEICTAGEDIDEVPVGRWGVGLITGI